MVAVLPDMLQMVGVVTLNVIASPELAETTGLTIAPTICVGIFAKVIVWLSLVTVRLCDTEVAAG